MRCARQVLVGMVAAALLVSCGAVDEKAVSDAAREDIIGFGEGRARDRLGD